MARRRLALVLLFAGCATPVPEAVPGPGPVRPPNVLLLFADDLRADALGAYGGAVPTPHLDELAARGCVLERAYCMGSRHGAVCVPSRAMLLSGRNLFAVRDDLRDAETLPEALREAGHRTFLCGKWHNGDAALRRCFPEARSVMRGGMSDHFRVPLCDVSGGEIGPQRTGVGHSSELFADAAVAFLQEQEPGRPFFAYVAFTAPHDPRDAPQEFLERFRREPPPLPPNFRGQHGLDLGEATMTVRDEDLLPWPRPPELVVQQLAEYHGMIAHLDGQVGRILAALRERGLQDDTLVVFAADHGLALGSHGLLGKQSLYEHSMRAPVLLAGPGVPAGRRVDALCYLSDLAPTLCAAAGARAPVGADGQDLWPVLRDPGAFPPRQALFTAYANTQRAVTDGRWKLIRLPHIDRTLLFDLRADPHERHDLAEDPACAAELGRMSGLLLAQQRAFGDELPWAILPARPATVDLTGHARQPDRWQPAWIVEKYFR